MRRGWERCGLRQRSLRVLCAAMDRIRIVSTWIHSGHPSDIESVMIDGQFVIRNGKVLTMDEESIIKQADAVGRRVWTKVLEAGPVPVPRLPRPR